MKIVAMYLPQFHEVEENNQWWGEGFTEWTAVKKAESLYEGHLQPNVPLDRNYYNLLDKETMKWQADLMRRYNVHGMCFYHYWFKDGRRILEKPAENLLKWKDIDMPFCFSWANESWSRTWSKLRGENTWAEKFEKHDDRSNNMTGILLEQKYGTEEDWKAHFEYLRPFWEDKRYIRVDNKPVFIFYKPNSIPCVVRMMNYWNELAIKIGLDGVYFIGTNIYEEGGFDALLYQEPQLTIMQGGSGMLEYNGCNQIPYSKIWENIISRKSEPGKKIYLGGFTGYDDTPRRGCSGTAVVERSNEKFCDMLKLLLKKNNRLGNEYVFLNAWNEWGEGMYLEPDEKNGYGYLEAVKTALQEYEKDEFQVETVEKSRYQGGDSRIEKYRSYWTILDRWLSLKEEGIELEKYLLKNNIRKIAVYGLGMLGQHLITELTGSSIQILYGVDQRAGKINSELPVYSPDGPMPDLKIDAVIVTTTYLFYQILKKLREKVSCPIISLQEVIDES